MDIGKYIKQLRIQKNLTQEELGQIIGVQRAAVQKWESGLTQNLKRTTIQKLAELFEINPANLISGHSGEFANSSNTVFTYENIIPLPKTRKYPLVGTIACGEPIWAEDNIEQYIDADEEIHADFCLRCKGDSMINARIYDGDIVFVRQQDDVENGQIAVVLIENEATLKRVYKQAGGLLLQPENPAFQPIFIPDSEFDSVRIQGRAIAFISAVK